ncbi:glycosyltransferase family 4 protein [Mucilaginibacter phyllosphaerae]
MQKALKTNLGIDAKWYFKGPPSGRMVVKNLVDEIILNNNGRFNLFLLISGKFVKQATEYFPKEVKIISLPDMPNLLSVLFVVPIIALRYQLTALLFQNFTSPWPKNLIKITYIHDVLFLDYPKYYSKLESIYFRQMKRLAIHANSIIAISASEKKRLIANRFASDSHIDIVYHGINESFKASENYSDNEIYAIKNKYQLPARYLLFVGRINIRKNILNLVKALFFLDDVTIPLLIAGEKGDVYEELKRFIHEANLNDRIIFTGHLPEKDLQLVYACATIFCFPSYAEGFGLPPLEAMKCGVPVVTSNLTAMPEVCGNAAMYIDPDNPYDIARKINELLNNPGLYNAQVKKGFHRSADFVWSNAANQILTIIEERSGNRKTDPKNQR